MRLLASTLLLLAATGCVGPKNLYLPQTENISRPPVGQVATASVGDEMLSQGTLSMLDGIELPEQNIIKGYTLSPGFYPMVGDDGVVTYHAFRVGDPIGDGYGALQRNILMDPPKNIQASRTQQEICVVTAFGLKTCDHEHPYHRVTRPALNANNFQQTLIYSGRVGDKVNISYREFSGNVARPAFANDVEYDLTVSDTIAYKGARLRIIEATNESITYEVLANFNGVATQPNMP